MPLSQQTQQILERTRGKRVALFIDNANWFYPQKELKWRISYEKLKKFLAQYYQLSALQIYAGTPLSETDKATFARFCAKAEAAGFVVITKPLKKIWVDRKAKTFEYKCNFDVEIALDVASTIALGTVDLVMLGSGDSDFLAVKDYAFAHNTGFLALCFENGVAWEIRKSYHIFLEDLRPLIERL